MTALPPQRNLIAGEPCAAASGVEIDVRDPSTGEVFTTLPRSAACDIDAAVAAARRALHGAWGRQSATERGRILLRLSALITQHHDELSALECRDTGKPIQQARTDITACARYFEYYAGAADKLHGETIPYAQGTTVLAVRVPHGVTGHIIPWNYPAQIFGRSVGGALAAGNACVVKPAEDACLTPLRIATLALAAGLPPGALNIVCGLGPEAGAALAGHAGINHISFTGSPQTGTAVAQAAAANHVPVTLELGGKSPQILFADADLAQALPVVVNAIVQNAGQTCAAGSRVLIERPIYAEVMAQLTPRFEALLTGPGLQGPDCGPLINRKQLERVSTMVDAARSDGVQVAARARLASGAPGGGFYFPPLLLDAVPPSHPIAQTEVFGPVLAAFAFDGEDDAVALANGTPFGLTAAVWTCDGARQLRVAHRIDAGQVFVDNYGAGGQALPVHADVTQDTSVEAMVAATLKRFGRLDILVNNAGTTHKNQPMLEVDEQTFDRVYATNVKSIYLGARHAVPVFRRQGSGVIVNVASTAGLRPRPGLSWYSGTKGAAITLTKAMAVELAPDRIRVVAINPVMGETGLLADFLPGEDSEEVRRKIIATIPLGRLSRPLDIAKATAFLASDDAEFITGVALEVDGGRCI